MTPDPMTTGEDRAPLGVRVAIGFLRVFCVFMYLPLLLSSLAVGMVLIRGLFETRGIARDFLVVVVPFGGFLILLMTQLSGDWLARHLKATTTGSGWDRIQRPFIRPVTSSFHPCGA
jgi:energy-coupling factor transporter transmembrane protein EcfT